jgi:hypothetical protein
MGQLWRHLTSAAVSTFHCRVGKIFFPFPVISHFKKYCKRRWLFDHFQWKALIRHCHVEFAIRQPLAVGMAHSFTTCVRVCVTQCHPKLTHTDTDNHKIMRQFPRFSRINFYATKFSSQFRFFPPCCWFTDVKCSVSLVNCRILLNVSLKGIKDIFISRCCPVEPSARRCVTENRPGQ